MSIQRPEKSLITPKINQQRSSKKETTSAESSIGPFPLTDLFTNSTLTKFDVSLPPQDLINTFSKLSENDRLQAFEEYTSLTNLPVEIRGYVTREMLVRLLPQDHMPAFRTLVNSPHGLRGFQTDMSVLGLLIILKSSDLKEAIRLLISRTRVLEHLDASSIYKLLSLVPSINMDTLKPVTDKKDVWNQFKANPRILTQLSQEQFDSLDQQIG